MQVGWVKIGHFQRKMRYKLKSSAIAEGPRDMLVSTNPAI